MGLSSTGELFLSCVSFWGSFQTFVKLITIAAVLTHGIGLLLFMQLLGDLLPDSSHSWSMLLSVF